MKKLSLICLFVLSATSTSYALTWSDIGISHNMYKANHAFSRGGYGYAGGVVAKFKRDTFSLMTVEPPHVKAGCGGIDISLGGVSFISFDELKDKLKAIMQNAQGYAFKLAISTLCKECDAILSSLEAISDAINSINFDSCAIAEKGVDYLGGQVAGFLTGEGYQKDWKKGWEERESNFANSLKTYTNTITDKIKNVGGFFGSGDVSNDDKNQYIAGVGSVIYWTIKKANKSTKYEKEDKHYQALISYFIGSDIVREVSGATIVTKIIPVEPKNKEFQNVNGVTNKIDKIFNIIFEKNSTEKLEMPVWIVEKVDNKDIVETSDVIIDIKNDIGRAYKDLNDGVFKVLEDMTTNYSLTANSIDILNSYPELPREFFNSIVFDNSVLKSINSKTTLNYTACKNGAGGTRNILCDNIDAQIGRITKVIALKIISSNIIDKLSNFRMLLSNVQNDKNLAVDKENGFPTIIDEKYLDKVDNAIKDIQIESQKLITKYEQEYQNSIETIQKELKKQEKEAQAQTTGKGGKK